MRWHGVRQIPSILVSFETFAVDFQLKESNRHGGILYGQVLLFLLTAKIFLDLFEPESVFLPLAG